MRSRIFSSDGIKVSLKGQLWIPILLAFGFFMAFPVSSLLQLSNWRELAYTQNQVAYLYENLWKDGFLCTGMIVMLFAAVLNGINGFWYLYSSRKVDFYHSLPERKSSMYAHRVVMAFLYTIIPYMLMLFAAVCVGITYGYYSLYILKMAAAMAGIHILVYFMMYFGTVLVITMTGNVFMGFLCLDGINLFGPLLGNVLCMYQTEFFDNCLLDSVYKGWLNWLSPCFAAVNINSAYMTGLKPKVFLIYCAALILLALCSYAAYIFRPAEAAGKALVYPWSEIVIGFMMAVLTGMCTGILFYMSNRGSSRTFWWFFGMIMASVLMHGAIQVICRMDFRRFFSRILWLGGAMVTAVVAAAVFKFDLTGFDQYVPEYEKLEDICITYNGCYASNNDSMLEKNEDGTYSVYSTASSTRWNLEHFSVGLDREIYDSLVQAATDDKTDRNSSDYYNYMINVRYAEKSGKETYRTYHLTTSQIKAIYESCCDEGTFIAGKYSFLETDPSFIREIRLGTVEGIWPQIYMKGDDKEDLKQKLLDALKKDVAEADTEVLMDYPCAELSVDYMGLPRQREAGQMVPGEENTQTYTAYVYVYPGFKRTVALLKDLGYPMSVEETGIQDITVRYYDPDNGWTVSTDMKYSREQEAQLKKIMHYVSLLPVWAGCDSSIYICVEDGDTNYVLDETQIPDFIKEDQQKMWNGELELAEGGSLG